MAFKTIMSPAKDGLYPLRIFDVRVVQGDIVGAETPAVLAETASGRRIAIPCTQAGRVIQVPPEGALLEQRQMLLVIETFDEATGATDPAPEEHAATEATAEATTRPAYDGARGRQERVRPAKGAASAPPSPDRTATQPPGDETLSPKRPAKKSRSGKLFIAGGIALAACAAFYAFTYTAAFGPSSGRPAARETARTGTAASASTATGWMNAPALGTPDKFTYSDAESVAFFDADVDSRGNALLAGRVGSHAILCSFAFGAGDPDCADTFGIPSKAPEDRARDGSLGGAGQNREYETLSDAYRAYLGKDILSKRDTTYPDYGFVVRGAFTNGDALAGFTPPASGKLSTFYRYDPASKRLRLLDDLAIPAHYTAVARSARYVAVLGQEIEEKRHALLLLDRAGNSDTVHITQQWNPRKNDPISSPQLRTFGHVAIAEGEGTTSTVDFLGYSTRTLMQTGIRTSAPFEGTASGVNIITKVKTRTTDATDLLSESESAPYRSERFEFTARALNPATGATATAATMVRWLDGASQKFDVSHDGKIRTTDRRGDVLLTIETSGGKSHRSILVRGDDFPGAGLRAVRILPLAHGRFALLLRESGSGYPISAVLIVDAEGNPLRQAWSAGDLQLSDITLGADGDLYAAGHTGKYGTFSKTEGVLLRYRSGDF